MNSKYDEILDKAKEFNYKPERYSYLKEVVKIARRAKLPFDKFSADTVKDEIEFAISLTGAYALYDAYKARGDNGYIVYQNDKRELIHHYANGRVEVINKLI
ncbi:hypothetical protein [Priestia aryabhattai]